MAEQKVDLTIMRNVFPIVKIANMDLSDASALGEMLIKYGVKSEIRDKNGDIITSIKTL